MVDMQRSKASRWVVGLWVRVTLPMSSVFALAPGTCEGDQLVDTMSLEQPPDFDPNRTQWTLILEATWGEDCGDGAYDNGGILSDDNRPPDPVLEVELPDGSRKTYAGKSNTYEFESVVDNAEIGPFTSRELGLTHENVESTLHLYFYDDDGSGINNDDFMGSVSLTFNALEHQFWQTGESPRDCDAPDGFKEPGFSYAYTLARD